MAPSTSIRSRITPEHAVLAERVRAEYREMPGLCLSLAQAARLLGLERHVCFGILADLLDEGFLRQTARGDYALAD